MMSSTRKDSDNVFEMPDLELIRVYANKALSCCPAKLQHASVSTTVTVENFVSDSMLEKLNIACKEDLLGLYKTFDTHDTKERELILFRAPLVIYAITSCEKIESVVARVTVYEISYRSNCVYLRKQWLDKIKGLSY
jgi:predicted Zn-dependent protease with MMP-like domain